MLFSIGKKTDRFNNGQYKGAANIVYAKGSIQDIDRLMTVSPSNASNATKHKDVRSDGDLDFRGGTLEESINMPDMAPFFQAKDKLLKAGTFKALRQSVSHAAKRKRTQSEYDGEFDFDKKWEIKPFAQCQRQRVSTPVIKLDVNFAINCMYSSQQINEYGAMCWALIQILETRGVNVEIQLSQHGFVIADKHDFFCEVTIKEATKYISPQALAHVFRTTFARRQTHSLIVHAADFANEVVDHFLGLAPSPTYNVKWEGNTLCLAIGALNDLGAVEKAIQKVLC